MLDSTCPRVQKGILVSLGLKQKSISLVYGHLPMFESFFFRNDSDEAQNKDLNQEETGIM